MRATRNSVALLSVILAASIAAAQNNEVVIDWSQTSKQLVAYPPVINYTTTVTVRVLSVNDLLYDYSGRVVGKPRATEDPAWNLVRGLTKEGDCPVSDALQRFQTAYQALLPSGSPPQSILVSKTIADWASTVEPIVREIKSVVKNNPGCNTGEAAADIKKFLDIVNTWEEKLTSDHEFSFRTQLLPDNDYTVYIGETYKKDPAAKGVQTNIGEQSFSFSPASDLVTVSGGFLFTELQGRSYTRQTVPGQTDSALAINGSGSVRPVFASTINVKLPYLDHTALRGDKLGLDFSIGPALQLGTGSNNVTKLGLFSGLSLVIANKVLITPGVHVGEFADFPLGFRYAGQAIPPNFTGQLTPVTRYTARFGIAVTLKGFSLLKSQSAPKAATEKPKENPAQK